MVTLYPNPRVASYWSSAKPKTSFIVFVVQSSPLKERLINCSFCVILGRWSPLKTSNSPLLDVNKLYSKNILCLLPIRFWFFPFSVFSFYSFRKTIDLNYSNLFFLYLLTVLHFDDWLQNNIFSRQLSFTEIIMFSLKNQKILFIRCIKKKRNWRCRRKVFALENWSFYFVFFFQPKH